MARLGEGIFITFEGIDCSGKSTQVERFAERVKQMGIEVVVTREPGGTPVSERIRTILKEDHKEGLTQAAELFLFEAARSQIVGRTIQPALNRGAVVICDRFTDSTFAYQGYARGHDIAMLETLNNLATNGLSPELTFFISVTPEERIRRLASRSGEVPDRFESETDDFTKNVYAGYEAAVDKSNGRMVRIDGNRSVDEIEEEIWKLACSRLWQLQFACA